MLVSLHVILIRCANTDYMAKRHVCLNTHDQMTLTVYSRGVQMLYFHQQERTGTSSQRGSLAKDKSL